MVELWVRSPVAPTEFSVCRVFFERRARRTPNFLLFGLRLTRRQMSQYQSGQRE